MHTRPIATVPTSTIFSNTRMFAHARNVPFENHAFVLDDGVHISVVNLLRCKIDKPKKHAPTAHALDVEFIEHRGRGLSCAQAL